MQNLFHQLGGMLGMSEGMAGLLIGIIIGMVLRSLSRLGNSTAVTGSKHSFDMSASMSPSVSPTNFRFETTGATTTSNSMTLNLNGKNVELDQAKVQELFEHLKKDRKIEAIRVLREASGMGLKEAKDIVEVLEKQLPAIGIS